MLACSFNLQGVAGVVDVLTGACKVHKLSCTGQLFLQIGTDVVVGKRAFNPVLNGLDIVVRFALYQLDSVGVGLAELAHQAQHVRRCRWRQSRALCQVGLGQRNKPRDFNLNTPVHIPVLTEQGAKRRKFGVVATV